MSEPEIRYRYKGGEDGPWYGHEGIPRRDLTEDDWKEMTPRQRAVVEAAEYRGKPLYEKAARSTRHRRTGDDAPDEPPTTEPVADAPAEPPAGDGGKE